MIKLSPVGRSAFSWFLALSASGAGSFTLPLSCQAQTSSGGKSASQTYPANYPNSTAPHAVRRKKSALPAGTVTPGSVAAEELKKSARPSTAPIPNTQPDLLPITPGASPAPLAPGAVPPDSLAPDALYPEGMTQPPPLPPDGPPNHNANKTMTISPTRIGPLIQIASLHPVRLDATYNEPVSLREALLYAMNNNLPIKISRESWNFQRDQFYGALGQFLPTASGGYSYTHTHIFRQTPTNSDTRVWSGTIRQGLFSGGSVFYGALAQYYRQRGWRNAYATTINDTMLLVFQNYNNLLLQRALLQIRAKSVETSEAQLRLNMQLYNAGTGTRFAVMQSRTQLASDRQALLQQQVALRQAGLNLAFSLNLPMAVNLVPSEDVVTEASLIDEHVTINDLINQAIVHRPELRQYEWFRLAAARQVQSAAAPLYPTVSSFVTLSHASTTTTGPISALGGVGGLSASNSTGTNTSPTGSSASGSSGGVSGSSISNAIGQTASFSPTGGSSGTSGANTSATTSVAGGGGSPTSSSQSGGLVTSGGGVASLNNATGAGSGGGGVGTFGGVTNSLQIGLSVNWTLGGLGVPAIMNIQATRALARQAMYQANQELLLVTQQVRTDYLNALTAREQIDVAASGVASSGEALRLANLRVQTGVGTNLELITAQRDYITALISQVQAIIASNQAQGQLLHDTGMISLDALTRRGPTIGSNSQAQ